MTQTDTIERAVKEIKKWGPRRVLIDKEGKTTTPERANRLQNKLPDVIFIRSDGWTLGAISELAAEAEDLWKNEWIAVMISPIDRPISYEQYQSVKGPMVDRLMRRN
jgi:hypothetical protein